ncbi:unnamed protein product [Mycena citricolor]|uniref:Uncharacterized protein n=1 Tax=Mycena citricolor TaxID=2018698 RepID=A0AAD2HIJ1_9AGAR|nr:unnamed protein product [Mycena citricolor]
MGNEQSGTEPPASTTPSPDASYVLVADGHSISKDDSPVHPTLTRTDTNTAQRGSPARSFADEELEFHAMHQSKLKASTDDQNARSPCAGPANTSIPISDTSLPPTFELSSDLPLDQMSHFFPHPPSPTVSRQSSPAPKGPLPISALEEPMKKLEPGDVLWAPANPVIVRISAPPTPPPVTDATATVTPGSVAASPISALTREDSLVDFTAEGAIASSTPYASFDLTNDSIISDSLMDEESVLVTKRNKRTEVGMIQDISNAYINEGSSVVLDTSDGPIQVPPNTYADATNIATRYPDLAAVVLAEPLAGAPNKKHVELPPIQNVEATSAHTADCPNWALAPDEPEAPHPASHQRNSNRASDKSKHEHRRGKRNRKPTGHRGRRASDCSSTQTNTRQAESRPPRNDIKAPTHVSAEHQDDSWVALQSRGDALLSAPNGAWETAKEQCPSSVPTTKAGAPLFAQHRNAPHQAQVVPQSTSLARMFAHDPRLQPDKNAHLGRQDRGYGAAVNQLPFSAQVHPDKASSSSSPSERADTWTLLTPPTAGQPSSRDDRGQPQIVVPKTSWARMSTHDPWLQHNENASKNDHQDKAKDVFGGTLVPEQSPFRDRVNVASHNESTHMHVAPKNSNNPNNIQQHQQTQAPATFGYSSHTDNLDWTGLRHSNNMAAAREDFNFVHSPPDTFAPMPLSNSFGIGAMKSDRFQLNGRPQPRYEPRQQDGRWASDKSVPAGASAYNSRGNRLPSQEQAFQNHCNNYPSRPYGN